MCIFEVGPIFFQSIFSCFWFEFFDLSFVFLYYSKICFENTILVPTINENAPIPRLKNSKHWSLIYPFSESLKEERHKLDDGSILNISTISILQEESDIKTLGVVQPKINASLSNLCQPTTSSMTLNKHQRK